MWHCAAEGLLCVTDKWHCIVEMSLYVTEVWHCCRGVVACHCIWRLTVEVSLYVTDIWHWNVKICQRHVVFGIQSVTVCHKHVALCCHSMTLWYRSVSVCHRHMTHRDTGSFVIIKILLSYLLLGTKFIGCILTREALTSQSCHSHYLFASQHWSTSCIF